MTKLILEKQYSNRIFYTSLVSLLSVFLALYLQLYNFAFISSSVLLSSVIYWNNPINNIRRKIDICIVINSSIYQTYNSILYLQNNNLLLYIFLLYLGSICYYKARKNKNQDISSKWHCMIHIIGNISNIVLYIGIAKT
jgi:hypothetical protein